MKYFIRIFIFATYLLMVIGLFLLIKSGFSGTEIIETNSFQFVYGFVGLFAALSGAYIVSDYIGKSWYGENPDTPDKRKDRIKWCVFTAVFAVIFVLFRLHDTFMPQIFPNAENLYFSVKIWIIRINLHELFKFFILPFDVNEPITLLSLRGMFFMALIITLSYVFTNRLYKKMDRDRTTEGAKITAPDTAAVPADDAEDKE